MKILLLIASMLTLTSIATAGGIQPSVQRQMYVCNSWMWIGGNATGYACSGYPSVGYVAGGSATDSVISSLQSQINILEERVKKLEAKAAK
ncbi:MAG: hypothetical protein IPM57_03105 [Oligoflexia bacterium]|nr:hypothetical protein [Oligoflexia bacterium]